MTQNTRPDVGFDYTRVLVVPRTAALPSYVDVFSQTTYSTPPFSLWPAVGSSTQFTWRYHPATADEFAQNAAVLAFVVGSRTTAVGATRNMQIGTPGYPHAECLFTDTIDIEAAFSVGDGVNDHSYLWNYDATTSRRIYAALMLEIP